ncbi:MAG: retropepsin-like aspartic protease family protein [Burkholderiaceae bacterium]
MRSISLAASLYLFCTLGFAADIGVIGIFPGKAVLVIGNGNPKTYSVGNTVTDNIKLVDVSGSSATFEENGKRRTIELGEHINHSSSSGPAQVILQANGQGHYITQGQINGGTVTMLVDTGASMIALPAADAVRLGINYKKGQAAYVNTANGTVPAYRVTLNSVKVGDIVINQVDALVQETGLPFILLGMSFLNRTDMRSENGQMMISKRY